MKFSDITLANQEELDEANPGAKILPDARMTKMLALAVKHDHTFPRTQLSRLGHKATDQEIVSVWSQLIDKALENTNHGNLSADGKFDAWLTRLYVNQVNDYEDVHGEGVDALGIWKMLSIRGILEPKDQDFNRFQSIAQLQKVIRKPIYQQALEKIKDEATIEAMKRDKKEVVLMDTPRFYVMVPLNYGSCYTFNNAEGVQAGYCTGSSSGLHWFDRYSREGPMISIIDKKNMNNPDGKWQIHTATNQWVNANQDDRHNGPKNDARFAELFPGLLRQICNAMEQQAEELKQQSKDIAQGGWNIPEEIDRIQSKMPVSFNSQIGDQGQGKLV